MSHPRPENRTHQHPVVTDQEIRKAKEDYSRKDAQIQTEAEEFGEERAHEEATEQRARLQKDLNETLRRTNEEIVDEQRRSSE